MPWRVTSPMHERHRFVLDAEYARCSFAELCRRYGVSRKTGYQWLTRYTTDGPPSLADRSHRPATGPHATDSELIQAILQLRTWWGWGARKLHALLRDDWPVARVPAVAIVPMMSVEMTCQRSLHWDYRLVHQLTS